MFSKLITFLTLSIAAAPLLSLCLKHLGLAPVFLMPPLLIAQSALIGQLAPSVVIGEPLPVRVGNVSLSQLIE